MKFLINQTKTTCQKEKNMFAEPTIRKVSESARDNMQEAEPTEIIEMNNLN